MIQAFGYARRHLSRAPRFTALAVLTLALAAGGTGALVSVLNALVLRPLDVPRPEGLAVVSVANERHVQGFIALTALAELQRTQDVFESLCGTTGVISVRVDLDGAMTTMTRESVTGECARVLGVAPVAGRLISEADSRTVEPVAVISHRFWQEHFGGDPAILGRVLRVEALPLTIVGVAAPSSSIGLEQTPDIVVPLSLMGRLYNAPEAQRATYLVGRLAPGVTLAAARARIEALWPAILKATATGPDLPARRYMSGMREVTVVSGAQGISPLRERYVKPLWVLSGLALIVLVVACVNVGGLLLVRVAGREGELSVHLALGATHGQVSRQLLAEGILLALAGAAIAVPFAFWMSRALGALVWTGQLPLSLRLTPDARVLGGMLLGGLACGLIVGLPAMAFWRLRPDRLHAGTARTVLGGTGLAGRSLIVAQLALSLALVFSTGVFLRHVVALRSLDPGYRVADVYFLRPVFLPGIQTRDVDMLVYGRNLLEKIASLDGVRAAALSRQFPSTSRERVLQVPVRLMDAAAPADDGLALIESVSPGFFQLTEIDLVRGRAFTNDDLPGRPPVGVINESVARRLFGTADPIGRRIRVERTSDAAPFEIVGVVRDASPGDVRLSGIPTIYRPIFQQPEYMLNPNILLHVSRVDGLADAVRRTVSDAGLTYMMRLQSVEEQVARALLTERTIALLSSFAGGLGVLLAALGLYALVAYGVGRRRRELGLRMALGASSGTLTRMILREGLGLTLAGLLVGIPLALGVGRWSRSWLPELPAAPYGVLAGAGALLLAVGLLAVAGPARRAARTDPAAALRGE